MKKQFLYLCLCMLFASSCSDENTSLFEADSSSKLRVAGDGKFEVLGYGYDITDDYLGETATKNQVVDIQTFKNSKDGNRFTNYFVGLIHQREFYGSTSEDYINNIITSSNYEGSVAYQATSNAETKSIMSASFSGSVTKGNTSRYSYCSKYSFGRGDVIKKQRKYTLDRMPQELTNYLTKSFSEDLTRLSADAVVLKYGTHVLLDITVGGMYTARYKSAIIETSSSVTKNNAVKAGIKLGFKGLGVDYSNTQTTTETTTYNTKNTDWQCVIDCRGGSTNGKTTTLSEGQGPTEVYNFGQFTQSVDDTHSVLVDVNWNAAYPIYDFISDQTKKAQVKAAVEKYIKSKQVKMLEVVPLWHGWKKSKYNDNFGAGDKGLANLMSNGYEILGVECFILKNQETGSVPLYHGWKSSKYNDSFGAGPNGLNHLNSNGYAILGIEGYVYSMQYADSKTTVPLWHGWKKSKYNDNFGAGEKGLTYLNSNGYSILGTEGFVYPVK